MPQYELGIYNGQKGGLLTLLSTPTSQLMVSHFKHGLHWSLSLGSPSARKHAVVGALDFQIALAGKASCHELPT